MFFYCLTNKVFFKKTKQKKQNKPSVLFQRIIDIFLVK